MKKPILNEEIIKMRKMMGLKEDYDIDSHYEDSIMGDLPGETQEPEDDDDDLVEFEIPNWALSALINGDESGLTDEDQEKLNAFVDDVVSKYGNAHFMMGDESETDLGFRHSNDIDNLGNDCTMLFIRPSSKMEEGDDESKYDKKHGSPYDRGRADSWYRRGKYPHKWPEGTGRGQQVTDLTPDEIEAYNAGYDDNERYGDHKEWDDMEEGAVNEIGDSMSLSMATMSHLSDLQEEAPELRGKINFIKALVMKMDCKTEVSTEELDALYTKYVK